MEKLKLSSTLSVSRIALGFWRLMDWKISLKALEHFVEDALQMGVTTFDHADIYGNYQCEPEFGKLLKHKPGLRDQFQLVTKCGIKLKSDLFPDLGINHYDTSAHHILKSVDRSLKNFNTDHIDLLLIHRPDPLMNPAEIADAFWQLKKSGKVLNFGVSNFTPLQYEGLNKYFDGNLVTNQVEISPYCLEHFENGNIDFFMNEGIHPMAWSPIAQGLLIKPTDEKSRRIVKKLEETAASLDVDGIDKIIYAWLLYHPVKIIPIVGSGKIERLKSAVDALQINLSREQWYEIFIASKGYPLP